jgi:hypothetical protein
MVKISPFVKKLKSILNEPANKNLITWDEKKCNLVIIQPEEFSIKILPFYFKHCNFSSFIRQLNIYGFNKIDPNFWVFRHENPSISLFSGFSGIIRKKKLEHGSDISEISTLKRQINALKILNQRMFLFLSKIFDVSLNNYELLEKILKLIQILSKKVSNLK